MKETNVDLARTVKPVTSQAIKLADLPGLHHILAVMKVKSPVSLFVLAIHSPGVAENQYIADENER